MWLFFFLTVSVTSLARRLSTFFLNDVKTGDSAPAPLPPVSFTKHPSRPSEDQNTTSSQKHLTHDFNAITDAVSTPFVTSPSEGYGSICSSPFVLLGDTQVEAEVEVDSEPTLEEAEEALLLGSSPLRKELSLSLLACREGVYSSSLEERPLTPLPPSEGALNEDHSYACFSIPTRSTENGTPAAETVATSEADDVLTLTSEEQVCFWVYWKTLWLQILDDWLVHVSSLLGHRCTRAGPEGNQTFCTSAISHLHQTQPID